ncbi:ribonuclease HI [Propionibacterium cyclohexanicum]|uniref:ribonuclease H n=1 Tax=Propionibacterium cyclohexanicum TaxID=64702 RepID=A0A1H9QHY2_9ACTN|nr:ribonuclease HI family protein [Propionibacterium cyclohexanicum]SER59795.1 ribonuclease HI [Propionibacterium cyclohexanicum]
MITAAADGSSLSNPGPAGWAWYIDDDHWASGGWPHGTNNMGELMAVLDLLRSTAVDPGEPLHILCDSQYVINAVTTWMAAWKRKGWVKRDGKPVGNVELMKAIDDAMQGRSVTFEWVKGHAGHRLNEAADSRAHGAALAFQRGDEPDPGPGYRPRSAARAGTAGDERGIGPVAGAVPQIASDAQPGLFDDADRAGAPGSGEPRPEDADLAAVVAAERELLTDAVRSNAARLRVLLHPEFVEYGSSGRIWTRNRLMAQIEPLGGSTRLEVLGSARLGPDALLLRWRATSPSGTSLRSSVWVRDDSLGRPRWRLLFCQGTPQPA